MHAGLAKDVIALIFSGLASIPRLDTTKTQEYASWDSKNTLGRVKHHFIDPEVIKGLFQICD